MYRVDGPATADGGGGHDAETIDVTSEPPPPDQDGHVAEAVDAAAPLMNMTSNQLTLLYQGEVYVFDSVTPEKVGKLFYMAQQTSTLLYRFIILER